MPMFASSEHEAGGVDNTDTDRGPAASFGNAPRLLYGNTSRFGVVKGSIAARKANAAAAATAAKARSFQTEASTSEVERNATLSKNRTSREAERVAATTTDDAPVTVTARFTDHLDYSRAVERTEETGVRFNGTITSNHRDDGDEKQEEANLEELGAMGSYYELPKVSSAADLIRTASHDKSSHSLSQVRGLRQANVPTAYSDVASTGYYRPSDRIGRLYTSTAAALTSTSAQLVAKASAALAVAAGAPAGSGSGGVGVGGGGGASNKARNAGAGGKLVTAPFAAESREILQTLALQPASSRGKLSATLPLGRSSARDGGGGNQSPSPTGGSTDAEAFGLPTSGGSERGDGLDSPGKLKPVVIDSAQDTRTLLREMRSPPRGRRLLDVAPTSSGVTPSSGQAGAPSKGGGGYAVNDFRSWNPAVLDEVGRSGRQDQTPGDKGAAGGGNDGGKGVAADAAERQKESIDRYWVNVEDRMLNGSPNALGAGARSPLLELPPERVDGITSRLAFELRFIPGIELGAYQAYVAAAVNSMLEDVQVGHSVSVARAVMDYELKDPERRQALGIERGHLTAGPRWYQCQEYLIPEWRVLRQTGVSRARVRRSALILKRKLCSVETVMVGLEKLWHSGVVPGDWDTAAFGGSSDVVRLLELFF